VAQRRLPFEVVDWSDPRRECCRIARRKETRDEPGVPISVLRSRGTEHARRHRTGPDLEEREWAERTDRRASLHAPAASASYPRASASSDPIVVTSASWHLEFECASAAESSRSRGCEAEDRGGRCSPASRRVSRAAEDATPSPHAGVSSLTGTAYRQRAISTTPCSSHWVLSPLRRTNTISSTGNSRRPSSVACRGS
jgi:hypothetical protein